MNTLSIFGEEYFWIVPHNADTNLASSSCSYDRIVITKEAQEDFTRNWGVDKSFQNKKISDHWPVWAEFEITKDTGNQN